MQGIKNKKPSKGLKIHLFIISIKMALWIWIIIFIAAFLIIAGLKVINQYQRGVRFTLGKYSGIMNPGLNYIIPIIQTFRRVDIRQTTIDLKPQSVMTKDQVNLNIDGVVFYVIQQPEKVILNVENLITQLSDKASSELKEIIGNRTMSESLMERDKIAKELLGKLNEAIEDKNSRNRKDWGIEIKAIQINNINLPQELIRAMSKQAEAEREKLARVIKAQGEYEASKRFEDASKIYKNNPDAMKLRELQTYQEIGTERNTLIMVIPSNMANPSGSFVLSSALNSAKFEEKKAKK